MGALESVHFHRMKKVTIQLLHAQKNLADIVVNSQLYLSKIDQCTMN
jgi:hypothetical protein